MDLPSFSFISVFALPEGSQPVFVRRDIKRFLVGEDNESGTGTGRFFYKTAERIIDGNIRGTGGLAEMGGKTSGEFQRGGGRIAAVTAQNDVGTGNILGVEPNIVASGRLEGKPIILVIVFANENLGTVRGQKTEGLGRLFGSFSGDFFLQPAPGDEFGANVVKLGQRGGSIQRSFNTGKIPNIIFTFGDLFSKQPLRSF